MCVGVECVTMVCVVYVWGCGVCEGGDDITFYSGILRKFDHMVEVIMPKLPTSFDYVTDPEGRAALLWILGEYGEVRV